MYKVHLRKGEVLELHNPADMPDPRNIDQIKDGLVEKIESNLNGFKGNKHLFFDIYDNDEKMKITLNSKKNKIDITPKLLKELDKQNFHFKLN